MLFLSLLFIASQLRKIGLGGSLQNSSRHFHHQSLEYPSDTPKRNGELFIFLQNPRRNFHSNHWFHIGEYFLSRSREVENAVKSSGGQAPELSMLTPLTFVTIVTNSPDFATGLTKMTAFLLLLAFLPIGEKFQSQSQKVEFYDPLTVSKTLSVDATLTCLNAVGSPLVRYNSDNLPGSKFEFPRGLALKRGEMSTICSPVSISVGNLPVSSSLWFKNMHETENLRRKIRQLCRDSNLYNDSAVREVLLTSPKEDYRTLSRTFNLVIYDRNRNRNFVDLNAILDSLHKTMLLSGSTSKWIVQVFVHDEEMEPCLLYNSLRNAQVLLTTHGFQSTALLFLPKGAVLIEIFPYKYFKESYGALCDQLGIHHRFAQNRWPSSMSRLPLYLVPMSICMKIRRCRSYARGDSVAMPKDHISIVVGNLVLVEKGLLNAQNAKINFIQS